MARDRDPGLVLGFSSFIRCRRESNKSLLKQLAANAVNVAGERVEFRFSRRQLNEADLFALHLCRNAEFDLENCLDLFRHWSSSRVNVSATVTTQQASENGSRGKVDSSAASWLLRLQKLRDELDGTPHVGDYGLFEFGQDSSSQTDALQRAANLSISDKQRAIIFIHGMESDLGRYRPLMKFLKADSRSQGIHILGFQYQHDQSLARSAKFLATEIQRVIQSAENVDFVCHSAGGLVFRYYAEVDGGSFRSAVFQGTPHGGSELAQLRRVLEAKRILGDLRYGLPRSLANTVIAGGGQMGFDLVPNSLFLSHLNRHARVHLHRRYYIFRGKAMKPKTALLLRKSLSLARESVAQRITRLRDQSAWRQSARHWIDALSLPQELATEDLAVSLEIAQLPGAARIETYSVNHTQLTNDPRIMKAVAEILFDGRLLR